jgi:carbamoyltransferase
LYSEVLSPDVQRRNLEQFFPGTDWPGKLVPVEHHLAHAASAFYTSGFRDALILISDGMGEIHSMTVAVGQDADITVLRQIPALHSLGILYGVFTLYLGFAFGVDEYKVMGLAPYGDPAQFYGQMAALVQLRDDGTYTIPILATNRTTLDKETHRGVLAELASRFGPAREPGTPLTQHHKNIAAALQATLQATQLHVLRQFRKETRMENLCLAGGVALNCSANGTIKRSRIFKHVFIQPAAGDDGAALGAALYVQKQRNPHFPSARMTMPLWGPAFSRAEVDTVLAGHGGSRIERADSMSVMCRQVAERLYCGHIVGWFQGRMEYGPRALGSRSILADPRDPAMRDRINALVKKREAFRPFAPVVTEEGASTFFDIVKGDESTYSHMLFVAQVRAPFREQLPAVTHVDGSARVQTVSYTDNPVLWELLCAFEALTGFPILLNTSFNVKGQPIVCTPAEALDTFLFAGLDLLVMGDTLVEPVAEEGAEAVRRAAAARIPIGIG